ncbi:NAD-dependent protein deacetylase sirtuin-2 [Pelomyxa schiedti]|nr:NAD-dependent protein deacetylase sirtuin-2 [Pelomyxa schiedti]
MSGVWTWLYDAFVGAWTWLTSSPGATATATPTHSSSASASASGASPSLTKGVGVLGSPSLEGVAEAIASGKCKKIIVMSGAGISVAAGIPDFRTPGSGLYSNLQKYNLPDPQAIFDIRYFRQNPAPFFALAKEMYPSKFKPTLTHHFIRLLCEKKVLLRNFTQNIDTLEISAGIPREKLIFAHGSFVTSHCIGCGAEHDTEWVKEAIFADKIPKCTKCDGVVKPDIVFFGESLPKSFFTNAASDFPECDLLIIIGTSLSVQPFGGLINKVGLNVPRLLINREEVGVRSSFSGANWGMDFHSSDNVRDVCWLGNCDDGCRELARLIGWSAELEALCLP